VLTNKVMKHGFVEEMESILDKDLKMTHQELSKKIESIILDPSKIQLKLAADTVESCYDPIIQSGGKYDIKLSALSDNDNLSGNVVLCSLGARYKSYCASISRTFLVDVPPKIENTYNTLLSLYNRCLEAMIKGKELKDVYENARKYLQEKDPSLLTYLPKSFGFATGLEFRDSTLVLNQTNTAKFLSGQVFNLSVGFHNIPLTEEDTANCPESVKKLKVFSLLIADIVVVQNEGVPDVLTKLSKEFSDVSYKIGDQEGEGEEEEGDDDEGGTELVDGVRRSTRAREEKAANEAASSQRNGRQLEIMKKKLDEGRRRVKNEGMGVENEAIDPEVEAKDLAVYKSHEEYPRDLVPNRLKVDLDRECLLVPINGRHIPFHVSTIKSMTQPDPEMRVNFYVPGSALGKEAAKNMSYLVAKYGQQYAFIKELTFRSHDGKNLATVYQQFQELRRRVRQREQKAEQEKDLVVQTKLIRIKDQRVPRLQEVTIRPQLSGRKCLGTLEAHQNGLRFLSNKQEILDVMYSNVKHAIFQPCDRTTMVLVHFHLKDFILIGRKKHKDVQFYTEVIEASLNLEGSRRSAYDPDELDDEQREREMRKRLNLAFKEFCSKVEKVAAHYDFNLQIDVPFKKSGFEGNWNKEMVLLQPTTHCLVNLTEWPSFVITLSEVEHCHMERVTYATKNFDLTFIFKNWDMPPKTITVIETRYMDIIQDWLNLVEITCTKGPKTINWVDVMKLVKEERDIFYDDQDENGDSKPAGWLFLSVEESDDEDEDDEAGGDSSFSEAESDSDEEDSDDDEDSDLYDESDEDSDDYEEEDELEEKGQVRHKLVVGYYLFVTIIFVLR
jgi:nucleosome binding factor SPN SPT16 subunit